MMIVLKDRRGVSGVIVTVLLVVLALVLVGIVWAVVAGIVEEGAAGIGSASDCLKLNLEATSLINTSEVGDYTLNVERKPGVAPMEGYKVVLFNNGGESSPVISEEIVLEELGSSLRVLTSYDTGSLVGANLVQLTPYLQGGALCPTKSFDFS